MEIIDPSCIQQTKTAKFSFALPQDTQDDFPWKCSVRIHHCHLAHSALFYPRKREQHGLLWGHVTQMEKAIQMLYSSLASCISDSLTASQIQCDLSSKNIRIIKFRKHQVCNYSWIFAYRVQRRVMWFPMASLVHFCWNQALPIRTLLRAVGRHFGFVLDLRSSRRLCPHFK